MLDQDQHFIERKRAGNKIDKIVQHDHIRVSAVNSFVALDVNNDILEIKLLILELDPEAGKDFLIPIHVMAYHPGLHQISVIPREYAREPSHHGKFIPVS